MFATQDVVWSWQGHEIVLGLDEAGEGNLVLLLPALSSISTRREMHPLMARLASGFRVVTIDWPGFGTRPRPPLRWTADALSAFLGHTLQALGGDPHGAGAASTNSRKLSVVAAGHAATYILHHAAFHPGAFGRIVLVAPTWRGPLPTMAGGSRPLFERIRRAVETPLVGPLLYRLNVSSFVIKMMTSGHVYSDAGWLSGARLAEKHRVTAASGARFASAAFVTGGLDRVASRADFLALAPRAGAPLLLVYADEAPARSRAEMQALAALPGIRTQHLLRGKLSLHEEFPDEVSAAIRPFLGEQS